MVAPGCGGRFTHLQNILHKFENGCAGVAPEVMEECEYLDMQESFNGRLTKQEVKCRYWGALAQLQEPSHCLVVEYL